VGNAGEYGERRDDGDGWGCGGIGRRACACGVWECDPSGVDLVLDLDAGCFPFAAFDNADLDAGDGEIAAGGGVTVNGGRGTLSGLMR